MKLLIVDDEPHTVRWLKGAASDAFPEAQLLTASCLRDGLALVREHDFDIALVDLGLPDGDGIDLIRSIRASSSACEVVVATIFDDDDHLFPALKAGARGYVLKQQSRGEIHEMLLSIERGHHPLSPSIAARLLDFFSGGTESVEGQGETVPKLTDRESEVLDLISRGYTLAEAGEAMKLQRSTVATYVRRLYEKLEVNSRAEAATVALRLGLVGERS